MTHQPTGDDPAAPLGAWVLQRLKQELAARASPTDFRIAALWPAVTAWHAAPTPGVDDPRHDGITLEVSFQSGTDDDDFPIDPPSGLDPGSPWFSLAFVRAPSVQPQGTDESWSASAALVLWFAPSPSLMALLEHPQWDTGNALGFDFLGDAGVGAREWTEQPLIQQIIGAFGSLEPAAAALVNREDELRLV